MTVPATLPGARAIDTTTNAQCTQWRDGSPPVCIVIAQQVDIEDNLRIVGPNPVAIVSTGDLTVGSTGLIDVSSAGGGISSPGAGADTGPCDTLAGEAQGATSNHAGGGAGGSFTGTGGAGGAGSTTGAVGQAPLDTAKLHGGCPGGLGGARTPSPQARGGHGGGAVYVVAKGTIHIAGKINANAERGYGGTTASASEFPGGGGGGAGGMIVLDADMVVVDVNAALVANGGGGGGGASGTAQGRDGNDGTSVGAAGGTGGGTGTSAGGAGGAGSSRAIRDGLPGAPGGALQGGGGGGGGAGGYIHLYGAHGKSVQATNVSPPDS